MSKISLSELSRKMARIDFTMLATKSADGTMTARPMSTNREVGDNGDSWFFTYEDRQMVSDIERDANVGLTYLGSAGLKGILGAPGQFIHVEGKATVIRDKARFADHWDPSLDRWFPQGIDTPGTVMLQVTASRIHYWDGEDEGEVAVPDRSVWTEGP